MTHKRNAGNRISPSRARPPTRSTRGRLVCEPKSGNRSLEATMRIFWVAAAAVVVACGVARADEQPGNGDAAVGVGIICNTSQQAEQFVKLRSKGTQPDQAMRAVN